MFRWIGRLSEIQCSSLAKKMGSIVESVGVIRRKLDAELKEQDSDLVFLIGFETALAFEHRMKKGCPVVLVQDTTPVLAHQLIRKSETSGFKRLRSLILGCLTSFWSRRCFRKVTHFLPMSQWCAESLIKDYGVPMERITPAYPAFDLDLWKPMGAAEDAEQVRLLFVGNDFERKGGKQLLKIYKKLVDAHFSVGSDTLGGPRSGASEASRPTEKRSRSLFLRIVSNDRILETMDLPQGVERLKNVPHDEVLGIFQQADIFVFPTWRDQLAIVLVEAAACGLVIIARDVGGIRDVVKDGYNGYLMPYESTEEEWAQKIQYLIDHPDERARMGANSRKLAEEMFGMERFERIVKDVIGEFASP